MKFQDFFLPKISRSDPEVRKKAVREEIDVELLKQVMKKDADPEDQIWPESACTRFDQNSRSLETVIES